MVCRVVRESGADNRGNRSIVFLHSVCPLVGDSKVFSQFQQTESLRDKVWFQCLTIYKLIKFQCTCQSIDTDHQKKFFFFFISIFVSILTWQKVEYKRNYPTLFLSLIDICYCKRVCFTLTVTLANCISVDFFCACQFHRWHPQKCTFGATLTANSHRYCTVQIWAVSFKCKVINFIFYVNL